MGVWHGFRMVALDRAGHCAGAPELAVPAFFVIWFGLGALLVGLALLVAPLGATAQIGLWIVASVAMVGLWFRVFKSGEYLRSRTQVGQSDGTRSARSG
jgi:membrane protein implicated in regulation of membrane protease activity